MPIFNFSEAQHQAAIAVALAEIQQRLANPIDLAALAERAGYSSSHFRFLFRGLVGESVYQHIRRLRLERAAALMLVCDDSLDEIARRVGFDAREAFTRAFSSAFGRAPTAFRDDLAARKREAWKLPSPTNVHDGHLLGASAVVNFQPLPDLSDGLTVRLEELPATNLACVRHTGPIRLAHRAWLRLLPWAAARKLLSLQPIYFGLNYDDEQIADEQRFRYDAGIVVAEPPPADGFVFPLTLPAGLHAVTSFSGTFDEFDVAWNRFVYHWLPRSGFELRACYGFDRYQPPADLVINPLASVWRFLHHIDTDLCIPVSPLKK